MERYVTIKVKVLADKDADLNDVIEHCTEGAARLEDYLLQSIDISQVVSNVIEHTKE